MTAITSRIERIMTAAQSGGSAEKIFERAGLFEGEMIWILACVELALGGLDENDPARSDLEEIQRAAEAAIRKVSTISAKAKPVRHLRAV